MACVDNGMPVCNVPIHATGVGIIRDLIHLTGRVSAVPYYMVSAQALGAAEDDRTDNIVCAPSSITGWPA